MRGNLHVPKLSSYALNSNFGEGSGPVISTYTHAQKIVKMHHLINHFRGLLWNNFVGFSSTLAKYSMTLLTNVVFPEPSGPSTMIFMIHSLLKFFREFVPTQTTIFVYPFVPNPIHPSTVSENVTKG